MNSKIKKILLFLFIHTGIFDVFRIINRKKIIIVKFHSVIDENFQSFWKPLRSYFPLNNFEKTISFLSKKYHFITLYEAYRIIVGELPSKKYCIAFTFDDGYRNNYSHAFRILKTFGIEPTIFISTMHINERMPFWFDRLDFAIQNAPCRNYKIKVGTEYLYLDTSERKKQKDFIYKYIKAIKKEKKNDFQTVEDIYSFIRILENNSALNLMNIFENDPWSCVFNWEEVRKFSIKGITFGSHTENHSRLGLLEEDQIYKQLDNSKILIEKFTGKFCDQLSFPNGSYNDLAIGIAKKLGYKIGVTTEEKLNCIGDNPLKLGRLSLPTDGNIAKLMLKITGLSEIPIKISNIWSRS